MNFSKITEEIENELSIVYMPNAIQYIDNNFDNAWSKALDRFDHALKIGIETNNHELLILEGNIYKETILKLIDQYKYSKRQNKVSELLDTFMGLIK